MRPLLRPVLGVTLIALAAAPVVRAQNDPTLHIVTYIEAAPASQQQVATMLRQLADASRKEGAVRFEVLQRTSAASDFLIVETWKNQQALDAHKAATPATRFREQVAPLLRSPLDERLCVAAATLPQRDGRAAMYVVTHIDVGPGDREAAARLINGFAAQSHGEAGNLGFEVVYQKARTNHYTVVETWADERSEGAHQVAAPTKKFRADIAPFLGALYDQRWYRPL